MRRLVRWIRTPKGLTMVALLALLGVEAPLHRPAAVLMVVLTGFVGAGVDLAMSRYLTGAATLPDGGAITGLLVALIIDPSAPVAIPLAATAGGLVVKHTIRTRWSNVVNPAAAGLLLACILPGGTTQSWWGALGDFPMWSSILLVALGGVIADRENKLPAVLSFAAVYVVLLTLISIRQPDQVASAFRVPDLNAGLFFALFMITDPPTSPIRYERQVIFGSMVGGISVAALLLGLGVAHFPLALLAANAWESWKRPRSVTAAASVAQ